MPVRRGKDASPIPKSERTAKSAARGRTRVRNAARNAPQAAVRPGGGYRTGDAVELNAAAGASLRNQRRDSAEGQAKRNRHHSDPHVYSLDAFWMPELRVFIPADQTAVPLDLARRSLLLRP
jgi:hypothetical protein